MKQPSETVHGAVEAILAELHAGHRLRVWSLIVTIFGDAILPRGGLVPLAVLQQITARLHISPGAVRTALSRLAVDGLVERERDGRTASYRLSGEARLAFERATRRIYAAGTPRWDGRWTVAIAADGVEAHDAVLRGSGFLRAADRTYVRPETADAAELRGELDDMLVVRGEGQVSHAMMARLCLPEELAAAYRGLVEGLAPLDSALDGATAAVEPLDALAARILVIHRWRRILLRDPGLPDELLAPDWPGHAARRMVLSLHKRLLADSEGWLDAAGLPPRRSSPQSSR